MMQKNKLKLTSRQETFAQQIAAGLSQSDAYRYSYPESRKWADSSVWPKASQLASNGKVAARVSELQAKAAAQCLITIEMLINRLDEIRVMALAQERPQCATAVAAIMGQAKLLGLDKQVVEVTGNGMPLIRVEFVKPDSVRD